MFHPYEYQVECLSKIENARQSGRSAALFVMASGLGKTVTVALDVKQWLQNRTGPMLYLCHQNDILYQARTTFEAILGPGHRYGLFHGEEKVRDVDCLFASFQTMERHAQTFSADHFKYIVVDESHHSHAPTFKKTVKYFHPQFLLGTTATPDRSDEQDIREIYGEEVFHLPLEEALARGFLTPVDYRLLSDELQLAEVLETPIGKLSVKRLNKSVFVPKRDDEIVEIIKKHSAGIVDPRIIIFCPSIMHAEHFVTHLPDGMTIHSRIPAKERSVRLELFRQGIVSTVLTVDAFNEGIDIPEANMVVFLRSTESSTLFLQQLGRGLRKCEGKDRVVVLDFVGNCDRVKMVHTMWDDITSAQSRFGIRTNADGYQSHAPISLNVGNVVFDEKILQLLEIMERLKPRRISDVPELVKEYSAKNEVPANEVAVFSNQKVWWKCSTCTHEWGAPPANRSKHTSGCPACAGRVATPQNNLAVLYPTLAAEYSSRNLSPATEVIPKTSKRLWWKCSACEYEWQASGQNRLACMNTSTHGCPACAGVVATPTNNLAITHPELVKEYSEKNPLPATEVLAGTEKKLWWKCSACEYEWQARGANRRKGKGCPACAGKVVSKTNNLATLYPTLAEEYSHRNLVLASEVVAGTGHKLWWKCRACQHEWQTSGSNRIGGTGCPRCSRKEAWEKRSETMKRGSRS